MTTPKELYKTLSADFKTEEKFYFADRGEGMMQGWEKGSGRIFLVNKKTKEAWELITANGNFSFWDASAVERLPLSLCSTSLELGSFQSPKTAAQLQSVS